MKKAILLAVSVSIAFLMILALNLPLIGNFFINITGLGSATVYSINPDDLTCPAIPSYDIRDFDPAPDTEKAMASGFEIESTYHYDTMYRDSTDIINLEITNLGNEAVYIYGYGLRTGKTKTYYENGNYVEPGESLDLGILPFTVPDEDEFSVTPYVCIMVMSDSGKWYDYEMQEFDELEFETTPAPGSYRKKYTRNPYYYYRKVNDLINVTDPAVRNTAVSVVKEYPGTYNVYQLCSIFDYVRDNVEYISDPRDNDYWAEPSETLSTGAGDCEDYAILTASLVEAIGGTTRIYLTEDHAYAATYVGNGSTGDGVITALREYYNGAPVYYTTDEYGSWIVLDASSGMYAGDLPAGAAPAGPGGWTFLKNENITVVDIAPY
jgi:transglutaminase-like putative cysteine protease